MFIRGVRSALFSLTKPSLIDDGRFDQEPKMANVDIYDKPMCCSTGVCGPQVDPVLPRFAADLDWLKTQGHQVVRFNLAQQPAAFAENESVKKALSSESVQCLPLILVDGQIVSKAEYPNRETLQALANSTGKHPSSANSGLLPIATDSGECCGDSDCC